MKRTTYLTAIALIGFSGLAIAAGPDSKRETKKDSKQTEVQVLRGPAVHEKSKTNQDRVKTKDGMQERAKRSEKRSADGMPGRSGGEMRPLMGALRALNNQKGDLAVTQAQREEIQKIVKDQRAAMKAFMEKHRPEIDKIKADAKAKAKESGKPDAEVRKAAMEKIRAIMKNAPTEGKAKKKIMNVLSKDQQEFVQKTMKEQSKRMKERRQRGVNNIEKRRGKQQGDKTDRKPKHVQRDAKDGDTRHAPKRDAKKHDGKKKHEGKQKQKREHKAPDDD